MLALQASYIAVFALAATACYSSVWRASKITDADTERGLVSLLLFSGTWAAASVGRIVAPTPALQRMSYIIGLVVGLGSVGAWLYFCSAYAGYEYHRQTLIRQIALITYLVIVGIKLTNPLHSLYFTASTTRIPFQHLAISLSAVHWVVTGLAYSLTAVGFYLLYDLFRDAHLETGKLGILVSLTAVPVLVDIVAFAEFVPTVILPFNYEPIGVAVFAVGALFMIDETFTAVPRMWRKELVEQFDEPIILLTNSGSIRDFNHAAIEQFPAVANATGRQLETVAPELHTAVASDMDIVEIESKNATRFYGIQVLPLSRGNKSVGQAVIYKDITNIENQRRELQRQNDQLNDFSIALNHELRNAITVVQGFIDHSTQSITHSTADFDTDAISRANDAVTRMQCVISDLSTLARYGQTPESISGCHIRKAVEAAWDAGERDDMTYSVETDAVVMANKPRLEELFRGAFQFAHANSATEVSVGIKDETLIITENGKPLPPNVIDDALEFGPPVPDGDADMSLPNIRLLAQVHEWTVDIDPSYDDGVRIRISGITIDSGA